MDKSTFTPLYELFRVRLAALRRSAGLTQRDLARKLGRERSFVARIELGERRVDLVEFYWICQACGRAPREEAAALIELFGQAGRQRIERLLAQAREDVAPYEAR